MVQIINRPSSRAGEFGDIAGRSLASALQDVLQNISHSKVKEIQSRQQGLLGQQGDPSTLEALSLMGQQPAQSIMPEQIQQQAQPIQESPLQDALQSIAPKQVENKAVKKQPVQLKTAKQIDKALTKPLPKAVKKADEIKNNRELNPDPVKHAEVEAKQDAKIKQLPKLSEKQQLAADKETKPYFDDVSKQAKAAKDGNMRLDRMEELVKKGNLSNPALASFLDVLERGIPLFSSHIGIDLHALESIDSQEFRKLSNDFIKNAKEFFGSRVTDQDLKAFLKTVPTLNQSNEGRLRVIQNLRSFNDIALLKKKAMNEIIAENSGERPRNLEELVDERTSDQVDAIAKNFKERMDIVETMRAQDPEREKLAKILGI